MTESAASLSSAAGSRAPVWPIALRGRAASIAAFLLLALPLGLLFALRVPLGDVADEPAHVLRAASLLDGQWIGHRQAITLADGRSVVAAGIDADPAWEPLSRGTDPVAGVPGFAPQDASRLTSGPRQFFPLYTIATYCPVFYAPSTLGLAAALALGFDKPAAALAGRLAALLAFAGLGVAALALARRGQMLLFVVLALPMTLFLAGSFNQDGLIIATAVLAAALVTRVWDSSTPLRSPSLLAAAGLIALIVLAKPPYAPLAALLLLPLSRRAPFAGLMKRGSLAALAVLPALLWGGYAATQVATPIPRPAYEAGPLWPGPRPAAFHATDPAAQVRVLMAAPTRILTVPAGYFTSFKHLVWMGESTIGLLGGLGPPLPAALYGAWILAFAVLAMRGAARDLSRTEKGLLLAAALACLWAVVLSQYLSWSDVGATKVDGPQGRYLLPILPLLAPLLAASRPAEAAAHAPWRRAMEAMPYLAAALGLVLIPPALPF